MPPIDTLAVSPRLDADAEIQTARNLLRWRENLRSSSQRRYDLFSAVANLDALHFGSKGTRPESVEHGQRYDREDHEDDSDGESLHVRRAA